MALTSEQKHYIKKNIKRLPISQLAKDLDLPVKVVEKFARKTLGEERFSKYCREDLSNASQAAKKKISEMTFKYFLAENINFIVLIVVLVAISYANSLGNAFVSDDIMPILKNPDIGNIGQVFSSPMGFLQKLIHYAAYSLGETTPAYFRIFNIIFHAGSSILILAILRLIATRNIAIFSSIIFAVHPLMTESVSWVSGMPYTLYGFFFLLSFLFYILKDRKKRYLYYSIIAFAFTVTSADNKSLALFLAFPLYEFSFGNLKLNWKKAIPYFAMGMLILGIALSAVGGRLTALSTNYYEDSSGYYNPLIQIPVAISSYLGLIFWPQKLTLYHTEMQFSSGMFAVLWIFLLGFIALVSWSFKKNKTLFFWLSFFLITLAPTLTPLKVAWIVAERYVYLGTIGIIVVFAYFFERLMEKSDAKYRPAFYSFIALIVIALSVRTVVRNTDWKDEDHLWPATLAVSPSGAPIHNNMGDVYARAGKYEEAAKEFKKATEINSGYADAFHNLANTYQMAGDPYEAAKYYEQAISINPNIWQSYQNLAAIHFDLGDREKASQYLQKAIEINPNEPSLHENLKMVEAAGS